MACPLLASLFIIISITVSNYYDSSSTVDLPRPLVLSTWAPNAAAVDRCTSQVVFSLPVSASSGINNTEPLLSASLVFPRGEEEEEASREVEGTIAPLSLPVVEVGGQWYSYRSVIGGDGWESCLDPNSSLPLRDAVPLVTQVNETGETPLGPKSFATSYLSTVDIVSTILLYMGASAYLLSVVLSHWVSRRRANQQTSSDCAPLSAVASPHPCQPARAAAPKAKFSRREKRAMEENLAQLQGELEAAQMMLKHALGAAEKFRSIAEQVSARNEAMESQQVEIVFGRAALLSQIADAESRMLRSQIELARLQDCIPTFSVDEALPKTTLDPHIPATETLPCIDDAVHLVVDFSGMEGGVDDGASDKVAVEPLVLPVCEGEVSATVSPVTKPAIHSVDTLESASPTSQQACCVSKPPSDTFRSRRDCAASSLDLKVASQRKRLASDAARRQKVQKTRAESLVGPLTNNTDKQESDKDSERENKGPSSLLPFVTLDDGKHTPFQIDQIDIASTPSSLSEPLAGDTEVELEANSSLCALSPASSPASELPAPFESEVELAAISSLCALAPASQAPELPAPFEVANSSFFVLSPASSPPASELTAPLESESDLAASSSLAVLSPSSPAPELPAPLEVADSSLPPPSSSSSPAPEAPAPLQDSEIRLWSTSDLRKFLHSRGFKLKHPTRTFMLQLVQEHNIDLIKPEISVAPVQEQSVIQVVQPTEEVQESQEERGKQGEEEGEKEGEEERSRRTRAFVPMYITPGRRNALAKRK